MVPFLADRGGIECDGAVFNVISRTPEMVLSRKNCFSKFCKQNDKQRYCQVSFIITGKLLATHLIFLKYRVRAQEEEKPTTS